MAVTRTAESTRISEPAPRVMFVPVSGPFGMGELQRCLIIAAGATRRWPNVAISFVLHQHVADAVPAQYRLFALDDTPTRRTKAVIAALGDFRPGVTVFDGAGRVAQLRAGRRLGCRTVFVSSRPSGRRKLFRWRRLQQLDEGWLTQPTFLEPALGVRERFKLFCARQPTVRRLGPIFQPPVEARREALLAKMALEKNRYMVFCVGGSGSDPRRHAAVGASLAAAAMLSKSTGLRSVVLTGNPGGSSTDVPGVVVLESLAHVDLMGLLSTARLAFTNGGSLLSQAVALGTLCIAVPITRDQPARIAASVRHGFAIAGVADAEALANTARALLDSEDSCRRFKQRLADADIHNGLEQAVDALAGLLARVNSETSR